MAFAWTVDSGGTLNTSFVAAYNLESSAGTDDKGGFTFTIFGSPAFSAGKNGNAIDGGATNTTKYTEVTNNLGIDGGACSFSCWVNVTTAPGTNTTNRIVDQDSNPTHTSQRIYYRDSGGTKQLVFQRTKDAVANANIIVSTTLTTGTWYHLVYAYDGSTLEGWINGTSQGTVAGSGNGSGTIPSYFGVLGYPDGGSDNLSGLIDAVYVWSKRLSNTEIADLYNSGTGSFYVAAAAAVNSNFLAFM